MHDRREPTLSAGDPDIREQEPSERGPIFREPHDGNNEEPSLVFWVAAIALGILLGGLGVKVISHWYESRQAEAVVNQFAVAMKGRKPPRISSLTRATRNDTHNTHTVYQHRLPLNTE